jgi:UDP-N-acetylmuramate dehydrogenase
MPYSASSLFSDLDVDVVLDAPLGAMTWYGIGGRADLLIRPRSIEALAALVKRCRRQSVSMHVMGRGANLLVADEGVGGIVLKLDEPVFRELRYSRLDERELLRAMAGADMARTLMDTTRRGLEGLSQMTGIPASIGGAVRMNAGGAYGSVSDAIVSVTCLTRDGQPVTYPAEELRFSYRQTNIPDPIILGVVFRLTPEDPIALRRKVKEIFEFKKSTQPLAERSAGCVFKNPIDPVSEERVSAGKLIDAAGLKGFTIGGASVSTRHANFIITQPGAMADDVMQLLDTIRQRVFDHCGIELENELVIWRRDEDANAN